jgi:hypothetical protein
VLIFANSRTCVGCVLQQARSAIAPALVSGPAACSGLEDELSRLPIGQPAVRLLLALLPE